MDLPLTRIHRGPARTAMDLTDGSERGEYVSQDYILKTLGRPMRSINLMYCYYPLDKTFPVRARHAFADRSVAFQWDYPYDDYFPYTGGLKGTRNGEVFRQMQDIRRHGQDVTLTRASHRDRGGLKALRQTDAPPESRGDRKVVLVQQARILPRGRGLLCPCVRGDPRPCTERKDGDLHRRH